MAERCRNCGLELFTAQRFCRSCGTPTEELSDEHAPTRPMPPSPPGWGARDSGSTAPTLRSDTSPVYDTPAGYQPMVPPPYPSTIPPYAPPKKRSPVGWILAFIGMGLFVLVVVAVMMMARFARNGGGQSGGASISRQQGERQLDETSADTVVNTGSETTIVKVFTLADQATVSFKNTNGSINVTGWDQPKAELTVIKRGSDRTPQVFFTNNGSTLQIRAGQNSGNQNIRFELRLPRELARVELTSTNGVIKVADINADIAVTATNGAIELSDIVGVSRVRTTNGTIKAGLLEPSDRNMEFESTNGSIELTIPSDFQADLEASTIHGGINIDDSFGVQVEKEIVGQKAKGKLDQGGQRLRISTTNGNIKVVASDVGAKTSEKARVKGKTNGN